MAEANVIYFVDGLYSEPSGTLDTSCSAMLFLWLTNEESYHRICESVKIACVQQAFEKCFPEEHFSFEGINVASGVSDQPMGDEETLLGAQNRAANCSDSRAQCRLLGRH